MVEKRTTNWRRRLQVSLRTWLFLVTFFIVLGGWWTQSAIRQKKAVNKLRSNDVQVLYDDEHRLPVFNSSWPPQLLEDTFGRDCFRNVTCVSASQSQMRATKEEVLSNIVAFPHLKSLFLAFELTGADLEAVSAFSELECLDFVASERSEAGYGHLKRLQSLRELEIQGGTLTECGGIELSQLPALRDISLCDMHVTIGALTGLAKRKELKNFSLIGIEGITDEHLGRISTLKKLRSLMLEECAKVTETGFEQLRALTGLKELVILKTELSESKLRALMSLKQLEVLRLWDILGSDAVDLSKLRQALPNCDIEFDAELGPTLSDAAKRSVD